MAMITVTCKDDLGFSPVFNCEIKKGNKLEIDEAMFADELFIAPKGWKAPAAPVEVQPAAPADTNQGGTD
jgi:hypothetical protein